MNRERAIRIRIYELLNENLSFEDSPVPVWDAKLEDEDSSLYVIIEGQSGRIIQKYPHQKTWDCNINLSIVSRQHNTVSRDLVDDVAEQIENLLYAGLYDGAVYEGWQFSNFVLESTNSNAFTLGKSMSEVSKDLIFKIEATKQ